MNKNSEVPVVVGNVPDHLLQLVSQPGFADTSLDTLKHHRVLNRMAIVQGQSKREIKSKFGEGSVIIPVTETLIAEKGIEFNVVPVMFFDEFITWGDRNDKTGPKIRDRSLDLKGTIAKKAADSNMRKERYGDDGKGGAFEAKHTHHLNFLVVIYSGPFKGTLAVLSFSRGEWKKGNALIGAIKMRRINGAPAPLWTTVWTIRVGDRKNDKGEWYGFDFEAAENPWIAGEDVSAMMAMHKELLKDYKEQVLSVGHEEAEVAGDGEDVAASTDM